MATGGIWMPVGIAAAVLLLASGCASVDPRRDYEQARQHVSTAIGQTAPVAVEDWQGANRLASERLVDGLSADEAVQLCLVANPRVQSVFLRIGMARADVVQSGLFRNPSFALSLRLPDGGGLTNLDASLAQNIADLWLIPVRKTTAAGELAREILEVAREVSAVALDARMAYFRAVGADREHDIALENRGVAQQLLDAALARQRAGAGSEVDVNLARAGFMDTELAVRTTKLSAFEARRELLTLLGLNTPPSDLRLVDPLPDPPQWDITQERLLQAALASRLDLQAASQLVLATAARVQQERLSVFANVEVGVSFEQERRGRRGDRPWLADTLWASAESGALTAPSLRPRENLPTDTVIGPTLGFDVPIFDQNQAQIAKAEYAHQQALLVREGLVLDVTQQARGALERARTAWDVSSYYRDQFVPLLQTNLDLSRQAYQAGKVSFLSVLEAQRQLLATRAQYVRAFRDSAVATIDLEKAAGQPIASLLAATSQVTENPDGAAQP